MDWHSMLHGAADVLDTFLRFSSWPTVALALGLVFRKPLGDALRRLERVKKGDAEASFAVETAVSAEAASAKLRTKLPAEPQHRPPGQDVVLRQQRLRGMVDVVDNQITRLFLLLGLPRPADPLEAIQALVNAGILIQPVGTRILAFGHLVTVALTYPGLDEEDMGTITPVMGEIANMLGLVFMQQLSIRGLITPFPAPAPPVTGAPNRR